MYRRETEQIDQKDSWRDEYKSLLSIQMVSELYSQEELNKFNFSFLLLEQELSSQNRMIDHHCMFVACWDLKVFEDREDSLMKTGINIKFQLQMAANPQIYL